MRPEDLIPRPRRVSGRPGSLDIRRGIRLASGPGAEVAAAWLGTRLGPIGGGAVPAALAVSPAGGGAECCVWTEHLVEEQLDAMLFPRVLACAELMWSDPPERDFADFRRRVRLAQGRWRTLGVGYGPETDRPFPPAQSPGAGGE